MTDFLLEGPDSLLPKSTSASPVPTKKASSRAPKPTIKTEPRAGPSKGADVELSQPSRSVPNSTGPSSRHTRSKGKPTTDPLAQLLATRSAAKTPIKKETVLKRKRAPSPSDDDERDAEGSDDPDVPDQQSDEDGNEDDEDEDEVVKRPADLKVGHPVKRARIDSAPKQEKGIPAVGAHALPGPPHVDALGVDDVPSCAGLDFKVCFLFLFTLLFLIY